MAARLCSRLEAPCCNLTVGPVQDSSPRGDGVLAEEPEELLPACCCNAIALVFAGRAVASRVTAHVARLKSMTSVDTKPNVTSHVLKLVQQLQSYNYNFTGLYDYRGYCEHFGTLRPQLLLRLWDYNRMP